MYDHVRYDLLADADGEELHPLQEERPPGFLESEKEQQAFSFDSAFHYDAGADDSKYRTDTNYNSAFQYSNTNGANPENKEPQSIALNITNEDHLGKVHSEEHTHTSLGIIVICWVLTFLSYVFFIITSPIT